MNKISFTFIEEYVKSYNEGTPIKEVMVEYEQETFTGSHPNSGEFGIWSTGDEPILKLTPDGSVITHPVEENPIEQILIYMVKHKYNETNPVLYGHIASYIDVNTKNKS